MGAVVDRHGGLYVIIPDGREYNTKVFNHGVGRHFIEDFQCYVWVENGHLELTNGKVNTFSIFAAVFSVFSLKTGPK